MMLLIFHGVFLRILNSDHNRQRLVSHGKSWSVIFKRLTFVGKRAGQFADRTSSGDFRDFSLRNVQIVMPFQYEH